jgi:phosphoribosylamine--glycine ligase
MGSYSPVDLPSTLIPGIEREVIEPTIRTMAEDGHPYRGFLYVGLALTAAGAKVIEFNCRLGDPETQVVLPRLDSDLLPVLASGAAGDVGGIELAWSDDATVNVVLAAAGYPDAPRRGDPISGLDSLPDDVTVFHAGTGLDGGRPVTAGGRILSVVGRGPDVATARSVAYEGVGRISFRGMRYRSDIAAM